MRAHVTWLLAAGQGGNPRMNGGSADGNELCPHDSPLDRRPRIDTRDTRLKTLCVSWGDRHGGDLTSSPVETGKGICTASVAEQRIRERGGHTTDALSAHDGVLCACGDLGSASHSRVSWLGSDYISSLSTVYCCETRSYLRNCSARHHADMRTVLRADRQCDSTLHNAGRDGKNVVTRAEILEYQAVKYVLRDSRGESGERSKKGYGAGIRPMEDDGAASPCPQRSLTKSKNEAKMGTGEAEKQPKRSARTGPFRTPKSLWKATHAQIAGNNVATTLLPVTVFSLICANGEALRSNRRPAKVFAASLSGGPGRCFAFPDFPHSETLASPPRRTTFRPRVNATPRRPPRSSCPLVALSPLRSFARSQWPKDHR
ncbi:hypothetical protein ANO11243_014510 [Dothideomycetidae sp. 11243]|nr:hypothetical protein ANO11243_014510 [fungal sp. No.11243]